MKPVSGSLAASAHGIHVASFGSGAKRVGADAVLVTSKQAVMQVFLDTDENYSVCGYAKRMKHSFGLVYLGLDRGSEYDREAEVINAAIMAVSEGDAFDDAFRAAKAVVLAQDPHRELDVNEVSTRVLAAVCEKWFDLPGDADLVVGGSVVDLVAPAQLPGGFGAPSGYIFKPYPPAILVWLGRRSGTLLHHAVLKFVEHHREPGSAVTGVLSAAMFAAFPSPSQNDLLARSIIGVLMGLLPTIDGNLTTTIKHWRDTRTFDALRDAFLADPEADLYRRAGKVLRSPLMQAMQTSPVPDAVWRTCVKDHQLGMPPVAVKAGDVVNVSIAAATQADLAAGVLDVSPVFGGVRTPASPHPTHACPGYSAAMGILLGTIAAIMLVAKTHGLRVDTTNVQM